MTELPRLDAEVLRSRLGQLGSDIGKREAAPGAALEQARRVAERLHGLVRDGLAAFHAAARQAGSPHLQIELSPPRLDDKHVRAVEFELRRGRHLGIVTVKSRGEVTLVGPFRSGKTEGPCLSFPYSAEDELQSGLADFLESFLEEATTP